MSGEDEKLNKEFSLEDILNEYRDHPAEEPAGEPEKEASEVTPVPEDSLPEEEMPEEEPEDEDEDDNGLIHLHLIRPEDEEPEDEEPAEEPEEEPDTESVPQESPDPQETPDSEEDDEEDSPEDKPHRSLFGFLNRNRSGQEPEEDENEDDEEQDTAEVIEFPQETAQDKIKKFKEKLEHQADEFSQHMYEEEGREFDSETIRLEKLVPGVDLEDEPEENEDEDEEEEEEERTDRGSRRAPKKQGFHIQRHVEPPPPDDPPKALFYKYSKNLKGLYRRTLVVLALSVAALVPVIGTGLGLLNISAYSTLYIYLSALALIISMLVGMDVLMEGFTDLLKKKFGMNVLVSISCILSVLDAVTMPVLGQRDGNLPYCALASLSLFFCMLGTFHKRSGLRLACRTAGSAKEPYLVTLDKKKWNNRDAYTKWDGTPEGFGSQIQQKDASEKIFGALTPVLLVLCIIFSVAVCAVHKDPKQLLWCLSADTAACASLSAMLAFGRPFHRISRHLAKDGAALAGWPAAEAAKRKAGIILTDLDLFPPGYVKFNGIKVFGDISIEMLISYTASVIVASNCGLSKIFDDLLRTHGSFYREVQSLNYEEGGYIARMHDHEVLVGTSQFMRLESIALPTGLSVKNAVFCAIDGELAGIFALNYIPNGTVESAIDAMLLSGLDPVLATRDFNLIPNTLRQRFNLPADQMEYPAVERRQQLSDPNNSEHSSILTAVLCREGLTPFSDSAIGASRLRRAVYLCTLIASFGSVLGLILSTYLTLASAYASLSAFNLTIFAVLWLVPTFLISGWVDRY